MRPGIVLAAALLAIGAARARADPPPGPLAEAQAAIFLGSAEDILDKPDCPPNKRPTLACKDDTSYVHTNEWHVDEFRRYIAGSGGGYLGIGSDQGLTFVAWSRAELAWFMDYDPKVVAVNRVIRGLVLASDDPAAFVARWKADRHARADAKKILGEQYAGDPALPRILAAYDHYRDSLRRHFEKVVKRGRRRHFHFLNDAGDYAYVRGMYQNGRIRILGGDLLADTALRGIAAAATSLAVPIRVLYLSNAEQWNYTPVYRGNMTALPFDDKSVVLRALWGTPKWGDKLDSYFYVVESGRDFQRRLVENPEQNRASKIARDRVAARKGVFTIGL